MRTLNDCLCTEKLKTLCLFCFPFAKNSTGNSLGLKAHLFSAIRERLNDCDSEEVQSEEREGIKKCR